jgi:hypothetical protein
MGTVWAGGSPNFDERTGQYKQPPAQQSQPKPAAGQRLGDAYRAYAAPFTGSLKPTALANNYNQQQQAMAAWEKQAAAYKQAGSPPDPVYQAVAAKTPAYFGLTGSTQARPAPQTFDPSAIMRQHGYGDYKAGPVTKVAASTAPPPSNQVWTQAWNQSRQQFPTAGQTPRAVSYSAPGTHYRQPLRFDGRPQPAPVFVGNSDRGNYAYAQPGYRPEAYSQRSTDFTGTTSRAPDFARRDAFIAQLNERLGTYQNRAGVFGSPQQMAQPSYDVRSLWNNAGDMVKSGWSNPFALARGR